MLPEKETSKYFQGIVIDVGPGVRTETGNPFSLDVITLLYFLTLILLCHYFNQTISSCDTCMCMYLCNDII